MKKVMLLIIIPLLFCGVANAQDSCFVRSVDKFTGKTTLSIRNIYVDKNTISAVSVDPNSKGIYKRINIFFKTIALTSVDEKSRVTFLYQDDTKDELQNSSDYNLNGGFQILIYDTRLAGFKKIISNLTTKKIKAIRLNGFRDIYDIDLTDENASILQQAYKCIYDAWTAKNR